MLEGVEVSGQGVLRVYRVTTAPCEIGLKPISKDASTSRKAVVLAAVLWTHPHVGCFVSVISLSAVSLD